MNAIAPDAARINAYTYAMAEFTRNEVLKMIAAIPVGNAVDFAGFDLGGLNLRKVNLHGADMRKSNLSGVDLREADLSKANLSETNLSGAHLGGADLTGTTMPDSTIHE